MAMMVGLLLASLDKLTKESMCSIMTFLASHTMASDHNEISDEDDRPSGTHKQSKLYISDCALPGRESSLRQPQRSS